MPLRRPDQNPPHPSDTPQRLREIALELFACKGYQSTSLRDIAAHLGIHAGSIYHHVENKQTLLFDLIEDVLHELLHVTQKKVKRATTASANLSLFIRIFINFKKLEHRRLLLVCRESFNLTPEQRQCIADLRNQYTRYLSVVIDSERTLFGLPHTDTYALSETIVAILLSTPLWESSAPYRGDGDVLLALFFRSITAAKPN